MKYISKKNVKVFVAILGIVCIISSLYFYRMRIANRTFYDTVDEEFSTNYNWPFVDNILVNVIYEIRNNAITKEVVFKLDRQGAVKQSIYSTKDSSISLDMFAYRGTAELLDSMTGYSSSEEFVKITNDESQNLFNTHKFCDYKKGYEKSYAGNSKEYFYQSFAFYYVNEKTNKFLKEYAPETFDYIKRISDCMGTLDKLEQQNEGK